MDVMSRDLVIKIAAEEAAFEKGMKSAAQSAKVFEQAIKEQEAAQRKADETAKRALSEQESAKIKAQNAAKKAQAEEEERLRKLDAAYSGVGETIAAAGAAAVAAAGLAVTAAIDWESAWTGVTKTVNGTPEQMEALEGQLRELARTLPLAHEEIAGVAEAAGQLGIKRDAITGFTKTMIDLGNTTNLSAEDAASSIAKMANIMGTSQQDVDRFGSALVALGNDGASTEADILEMATRIAGAGKLVGATETEVLALASAMSSIGIQAEAGGSSMSRIMQEIYTAVSAGKDDLAGFAEVAGMTADEFSTKFKNEPVQAINDFIKGLNRVESSGGNVIEVMSDLGIKGSEDLRTMLGLKGASDLLTDALNVGSKAWAENNALTDEANKRYGTAASQIQVAWNTIKDAAIDVGGAIMPVLGEIASAGGNIAKEFAALPGPVQEVLGLLAGVGGIGALVAGGFMMMLPRIRETKLAWRDLTGEQLSFRSAAGQTAGFVKTHWKGALAVLATGAALAAEQMFAMKPQLEAIGVGLVKTAGSGKLAGEAARVFGEDMGKLEEALRAVTSNGVEIFLAEAVELVPLVSGFDNSFAKAKERVSSFDNAMKSMVETGNVAAAQAVILELTRSGQVSMEQLKAALPGYFGALEVMASKAADSKPKSDAAAQGIEGIGDKAKDAEQDLKDLIDALKNATAPFKSLETSAINWEAAIDNAKETLKENGKNLDINTEKGRANKGALMEMAGAAQDHIAALIGLNGNTVEAHKVGEEHRKKLVETAIQFGMTRKQAEDYIGKLLAIPPETPTNPKFNNEPAQTQVNAYADAIKNVPKDWPTMVSVRTAEAEEKIKGFKAWATEFLKVTVTTLSPQLPADAPPLYPGFTPAYADGGIVRFASGAEDHRAQIANPGDMRLWAEPETGGEAYIPLASSKRDRSMSILATVAKEFGYELVPKGQKGAESFAAGGVRGGDTSAIGEAASGMDDELTPALEAVATVAGEDAPAAIQLLTEALIPLTDQTTTTGTVLTDTWTANRAATDAATLAMTAAMLAMQDATGVSWAQMVATSGSSVGTITGPQFGALTAALFALQGGFANTASVVGVEMAKIKGYTADPIKFAIAGPINNGLVSAWNQLNSFFSLGKVMGPVAINFADGGEYHHAQIAPAGAYRVWAEDETGGEAYIPLGSSKRARSTDILATVADRFGYELAPKGARFFADGGLWKTMYQIVKGAHPGATLNSSYRPGDPGYHGSGRATDLGGPMGAINAWLAAKFPQSTELIYTPGINLWHGKPHTYNAATRADHYDHVHWAMENAALLGGGKGGYYGPAPEFDFKAYMEEQFVGARNQAKEITGKFGQNHIAIAAEAMVNQATTGAVESAVKLMSEVTMGAGGGVERWRPTGLKALAIAGQPLTEISRLLMQMRTESNGDPMIVNDWDSNWIAGHPSVGLMQVIGPTYKAYKHPQFDVGPYLYGTSVNPLANILASTRYTLAEYGSLAAGWQGHGYDLGGVASGVGFLAKYTQSPERVLSPDQTVAFERLVNILDTRRGAGGALGMGGTQVIKNFNLTVYNAANNEVNLKTQFQRMELMS